MGTAYSYSFLTSSEVELIFLHIEGKKKKKELKERDVVALTMTAKLAKSCFQLLLHYFNPNCVVFSHQKRKNGHH